MNGVYPVSRYEFSQSKLTCSACRLTNYLVRETNSESGNWRCQTSNCSKVFSPKLMVITPRSDKIIRVGSKVSNLDVIKESVGNGYVIIPMGSVGVVRSITPACTPRDPTYPGNAALFTVNVSWNGRQSAVPIAREKLAIL